ncbi:hypothetical protein AeRB84_004872 [Aphanomyces euteiches]|nr:hypothetical protein AeRB84_004872 [Aphanomyces euteiches]
MRGWTIPMKTLMSPVMQVLGYDTNKLFAEARKHGAVVDLSGISVLDGGRSSGSHKSLKMRWSDRLAEDLHLEGDENDDLDVQGDCADAMVQKALTEKIDEARRVGMSHNGVMRLTSILTKYGDVFRLSWKMDPPVKVAPLEVRLKHDAIPIHCKTRRYSPLQLQFLRGHLQEIVNNGLGYINHRSRWASPPRIVDKKDGSFRMTVDNRGPNSQTESMHWPMPVLDEVMSRLVGMKAFLSLDWFKGYFQLALAEASQEIFSGIGPEGVVSPTRVCMGQTDAVGHCQAAAQEIYGDLYGQGVEAWLDDALGYGKTEDELLSILERLLDRCLSFGLKLNPLKCEFYSTSVIWCGKMISELGISHDPARINGLVELQPPVTARDLQQFTCALNWMRQSLPQFNELVAPLLDLLDVVCVAADSRKKTKLEKFLLSHHGWGAEHVRAFNACKEALKHIVTLAHPDPEKIFCLFCDASHQFWGAALTQIPRNEEDLDFESQHHEPLAFLSGSFKGASLRWSTTEKEGFAIVQSCKRLDYLLQRPGGFTIYTDHRNLRYIYGTEPDMKVPRYLADKLARWAMLLSCFNYKIRHVSGDDNVWGDLLSRWGHSEFPDAAVWSAVDGPPSKLPQMKRLVRLTGNHHWNLISLGLR